MRSALDAAVAETTKPTLIIGKTVMGQGAVDAEGNSFERKVSTHGQPLTGAGADFAKTIANLGGNPDDPFADLPGVAEAMADIIKAKKSAAAAKKSKKSEWASANPADAAKLTDWVAGKLPELDFTEIEQKSGVATRAASAAVLGWLAGKLENMIVSSADLSNSDKTDGFLKSDQGFSVPRIFPAPSSRPALPSSPWARCSQVWHSTAGSFPPEAPSLSSPTI
jgi:transketolase